MGHIQGFVVLLEFWEMLNVEAGKVGWGLDEGGLRGLLIHPKMP